MALFSECMLQCARKVLDSVSIVRDFANKEIPFCDGVLI